MSLIARPSRSAVAIAASTFALGLGGQGASAGAASASPPERATSVPHEARTWQHHETPENGLNRNYRSAQS